MFQHTAARRRLELCQFVLDKFKFVSTHSRPKAAGQFVSTQSHRNRFQHTAARRRLKPIKLLKETSKAFQHTAARRRLVFGFILTADN